MPNGGPDNCGTCPFNTKNQGKRGYEHVNDRVPDFCRIRALPIRQALFTYCANHPYHNPGGIEVPVGPVFKADLEHCSHQRLIWEPSPDTPEIRELLLKLLREMPEQPTDDFPAGWSLDEAVVWQVGEFRERRAVPDLERIAGFRPEVTSSGPHCRTRNTTVMLAREALRKIRETY
jgi:hypothetical protein